MLLLLPPCCTNIDSPTPNKKAQHRLHLQQEAGSSQIQTKLVLSKGLNRISVLFSWPYAPLCWPPESSKQSLTEVGEQWCGGFLWAFLLIPATAGGAGLDPVSPSCGCALSVPSCPLHKYSTPNTPCPLMVLKVCGDVCSWLIWGYCKMA